MRRGTSKPHTIKVRLYAASLIDMNKYLASLPGSTLYGKIGVTKLSEILLNSMPNIWSKQAYVQGFDCEYISFKKTVNMFELMDIVESIYEGVVEYSNKKLTREEAKHAGHSSKKIGQSTLSQTHSAMGESAGKRRTRYVDCPLVE